MEKARNGSNGSKVVPDPEVDARPERRRFTAEEKLRILGLADACKQPGDVGALLRKEGIFSSYLTEWRKAREEGTLAALSKKRGPKSGRRDPMAKEMEKLRRENERLRRRLEQAEAIIDVQKKVAGILGIPLKTNEPDGSDS